jgi:hypothetical protein
MSPPSQQETFLAFRRGEDYVSLGKLDRFAFELVLQRSATASPFSATRRRLDLSALFVDYTS